MNQHPRGSQKLTATDAYAIRIAHAGGESVKQLAERYHISTRAVWDVVHYETWGSVGPRREIDPRMDKDVKEP